VQLRFGPQVVDATLRRSWPHRAVVAAAQCEFDAFGVDAAASGANDSGSPLNAIESVLRDLAGIAPLAGASLAVELSDEQIHLDVIAGDFVGHSDRQLTNIASACVFELLGDEAGDHEVRWQLQRDDRHLLICAIPRTQIALLEQVAQSGGLRLTSLQPSFVVQWNAYASALKRGPAVFAVVAGGHIAIAWTVDGVISALSVGPLFESATTITSDASRSETTDERALAVEELDLRIGGLLKGFGFKGQARSAFSPSQPNPLDFIDILDARVDRLLTSIGQDPASQSTFVLVTADASAADASARWSVIGRSEVTA
jgi:hypothetical protein